MRNGKRNEEELKAGDKLAAEVAVSKSSSEVRAMEMNELVRQTSFIQEY